MAVKENGGESFEGSAAGGTDGAKPRREVEIDAELVGSLLAEQRPDWQGLDLESFGSGWDNALFRLGPDLILRLPRRAAAAELIRHEQKWLPQLAPALPLSVPTPVYEGRPAGGYPWSWSVVPYLPGETADMMEPPPEAAFALVDFLRALHKEPDPEAPANPYRDVPLAEKEEAVGPRLERLAERAELPDVLLEVWRRGVEAENDLEKTWIHGDLHPRNILVRSGHLSGIIDWGDITAGDPATDLASFWLLFKDRGARKMALERYGASEATLRRARGWAVFFGAVFLDSGLLGDGGGDAQSTAIGRRAFQRVLEGP